VCGVPTVRYLGEDLGHTPQSCGHHLTPLRRSGQASSSSSIAGVFSLSAMTRNVALTQPNRKGRAMSNTTLFERLGGYDAIAAVSNDLVDRLEADP
jgi:hypothetical protein